tara:strand:- start:2186 stop:2770 length:585 start_codon:yes stop_codon:yes gene_type:complete
MSLRSLIRENIFLLLEAAEGFYSNSELNSKIDSVLGPEYTNIDSLNISGFKSLMKEIAIVESGYVSSGKIMNDNEMSGDIKGVFQLSPIALKDLRRDNVVPSTKKYWYKKAKERGTKSEWKDQPYDDIYKYIMMQTVAACLYCLYLYYEVAGKPDLSSIDGRSSFWSNYYNSKSDEKGTSSYYKKKIEEFESYK